MIQAVSASPRLLWGSKTSLTTGDLLDIVVYTVLQVLQANVLDVLQILQVLQTALAFFDKLPCWCYSVNTSSMYRPSKREFFGAVRFL